MELRMDSIFYPAIIALGGLGLLFGMGLAYASKKFEVEVNPKVEQIIEALPGANCGACGLPGCSAFAEAVIAGRVPPDGCIPGGEDVSAQVSSILGVKKGEAGEPNVAVVQCQGGHTEAEEKFIYQGIQDCHAAQLLAGGHKACRYGCLGLASCVNACPFDAMIMNENGLPVVIEEKCTACGICVSTCPRGIMALIPVSQKIFLGCISQDKAKAVKSVCKVGCFACKICSLPKITPSGCIQMEGNLPVIVDRNSEELILALKKCPSKSYVARGDIMVAEEESKQDQHQMMENQQ
jgi:Na+-translocating ferredoxin:NAD+ oxidoreductase RNF subunit RnfB